jgi:hypothetical protein
MAGCVWCVVCGVQAIKKYDELLKRAKDLLPEITEFQAIHELAEAMFKDIKSVPLRPLPCRAAAASEAVLTAVCGVASVSRS